MHGKQFQYNVKNHDYMKMVKFQINLLNKSSGILKGLFF